jgi:hypothetical protein
MAQVINPAAEMTLKKTDNNDPLAGKSGMKIKA